MPVEKSKAKLVATASAFYDHEEDIAKTLTKDQIVQESHDLMTAYSDLVNGMGKSDQPPSKESVLKLQAIVVKLRCLNRRSNLRTKWRSDVAESKRKEVEKKQLTLQNLEMEIEHLQRSIDDLKAIELTDIDLVSKDEYCVQHSIGLDKFDALNEHDQQMTLMSYELELRKEFVTNIESMKAELVEKEEQLAEKEKKLDSVLPQIIQIRKLINPVLQSLELHSVTPAHIERTARSQYLPPQLSSLYVNVTVYNKVNEGTSLRFTCTGSLEEAIAFDNAQKVASMKRQKSRTEEVEMLQSDEDDEEEEEDLMDVDMPDSRNQREKEEELLNQFKQKQKLLTPHPISFTTEVPGSETNRTNLVFNYLPELDLVTVKVVLHLKGTHVPLLSADTILDELYPNDFGREHPTANAAMLQSLAGVSLIDSVASLGRPYKFAQQLCMVPAEKETDDGRNDRFKYFLKTMIKIGDRVKARSVLDVTFRNAAAGKILDCLPDELKVHIPNGHTCSLTKFCSITPDSIASSVTLSNRQQAILQQLTESGQLQNGFQFMGVIEHKQTPRITAIVHVPCAYPDTGASSMVLLVPTETEKFEYLAGIEALEMYLNVEVPRMAKDKPELMLALQIAILATRCEVVHDVSERDTVPGFTPTNFFFNFHRSRLQDPIFDFVPGRNAYGKSNGGGCV